MFIHNYKLVLIHRVLTHIAPDSVENRFYIILLSYYIVVPYVASTLFIAMVDINLLNNHA